MENESKKPIRPLMREMNVGETISFHISRLSVVRSVASTLSAEMDRVYRTKRNKLNKSIDVIRTA